MKWSEKWLSLLSVRGSWAIVGGSGGTSGSDQFNKYRNNGYYNGHQVIIPENLSLTELRREKVRKIDYGFNLELFNSMIVMDLDIYDNRTTDLVMEKLRISSANGFSTLAKVNGGVLHNKGWEVNLSTGKFC
jgi:hypothetical protein